MTRQVRRRHIRVPEVAYRFSGSIETIYASWGALSYTDYFPGEDQWNMQSSFRAGHRLGFRCDKSRRHGELESI